MYIYSYRIKGIPNIPFGSKLNKSLQRRPKERCLAIIIAAATPNRYSDGSRPIAGATKGATRCTRYLLYGT